MKRHTFAQLLDKALDTYWKAGDWRDGGQGEHDNYPPEYETMHRRCRRARAAVLRAYKARRK